MLQNLPRTLRYLEILTFEDLVDAQPDDLPASIREALEDLPPNLAHVKLHASKHRVDMPDSRKRFIRKGIKIDYIIT